jgi:hypothetical protein
LENRENKAHKRAELRQFLRCAVNSGLLHESVFAVSRAVNCATPFAEKPAL